ncbi:putative protein FAM172B [Rana temporaria]|uniref:putative protein FAM172B n=1 Tax=Rana temporaria TaxID=8407 RepID=UPI001AAD9AA1|nr:putative protein FAM172B [Rana temporaria]XP_040192544.1 putative protein FAM172B [Rana temporaria]
MEGLMKFKESVEIPQHFEDLQYYFNEQGELRHMVTNKPFLYNYYKNEYDRNHKRYKIIGAMITLYVYELLQKDCNLQRITIPIDAAEDEPRSFFFMSKGLPSMQTNLFVLLQDSGVVRAGQWGQKTIFHHSLHKGTQVPYIKTALRDNGSVIVLNPNDNFVEMKEEPHTLVKTEEESCPIDTREKVRFTAPQQKLIVPKRCCSSPEEHTSYVWDHFISKSAARNISFIAHGYGGLVFMDLLCKKSKEVMSKVSAVAFIDSKHHAPHQARTDPEIQAWLRSHCRSWVLSAKPLDRPTGSLRKIDCPKVSAGTENCDLAPSVAFQSIFRFLNRSSKIRRSSITPAHTMITRSSARSK